MTKYISRSKGLTAIVDDDWHEMLSLLKWCASRGKSGGYYASRGFQVGSGKQGSEQMHRVIADAPPRAVVDHINGNTLDNRRCKLRICTHRENICNAVKKSKLSTSRFKGVSFCKRLGKWRAYIAPDGRQVSLGMSLTEQEAAAAYNAAAIEYFGEFAGLNVLSTEAKEGK